MAQYPVPSNQELIEIGIEQKKYPPFLYKYTSVSSALRFLTDHKCYFSSFNQFNDPYEGRYIIQHKYSKNEWKNHFKNSVGLSPSDAQQAATNMLRNPKFAEETLKKDIQAALDNSGVYCLSSENDNILLWSYYTQNHKGICAEFSLREDADFFMKHYLLPVEYDDKFPQIDFFRDASSVIKAILHKAKCWEHEKEFRMVDPNRTRFAEDIKSAAITSIILGCKNGQCETQEEFDQINDIVNILQRSNYSHLCVKQEILDEENYKIKIVKAPFIARIYKDQLKITALKNMSIFIQRKHYTINQWDTLDLKVNQGNLSIRQGDFKKELICE